MKRFFSGAILIMVLMIVACGKKHDDSAVNPNAPVPPKSVINDDNNVEMTAAKLYGNIQFYMANQEEEQENYSVLDIISGDTQGHFKLDKSEKKYWVKAIGDESLSDLYEGASFVFGKVDGKTVAICYDKQLMPMWTMVGFQSEEEYNQYRKSCYANALAGKYKDSNENDVTITADGKVTGLFGKESDGFSFSYVNSFLSNVCRLESDKYFGFTFKTYGVDLLETVVDEEMTGARVATDEVIETLEMEDGQDLSWIHKHVLTSDYYNYISPSTRKAMIELLKAVKSPSQTNQWNLFILENFKDPEEQEIPEE